MTPETAAAAHARGTAIRNARALRVRTIRRRVISGALALFVALWLLITLMLVTGHDPALARQTSSTTSTTTSTSSAGSATSSAGSAGPTASSGDTGSGSSASAVTSRQS
jgi:hypothetical protein